MLELVEEQSRATRQYALSIKLSAVNAFSALQN